MTSIASDHRIRVTMEDVQLSSIVQPTMDKENGNGNGVLQR